MYRVNGEGEALSVREAFARMLKDARAYLKTGCEDRTHWECIKDTMEESDKPIGCIMQRAFHERSADVSDYTALITGHRKAGNDTDEDIEAALNGIVTVVDKIAKPRSVQAVRVKRTEKVIEMLTTYRQKLTKLIA